MDSEDKIKYEAFYSHSKAEAVLNERDIADAFELIYTTII